MLEQNTHIDLGDDIGVVERVLGDGRAIVSSLTTGDLLEVDAARARPATRSTRAMSPDERAMGLWMTGADPETIERSLLAEYGDEPARAGMDRLTAAVARRASGALAVGDPVSSIVDGTRLFGMVRMAAPRSSVHVAWNTGGAIVPGVVRVADLDELFTQEMLAIRALQRAIRRLTAAEGDERSVTRKPPPVTERPPATNVYLTQKPPKGVTNLEESAYPPVTEMPVIDGELQVWTEMLIQAHVTQKRLSEEEEELLRQINAIIAETPEGQRLSVVKEEYRRAVTEAAEAAKMVHRGLAEQHAARLDLSKGVFSFVQTAIQGVGRMAKHGYNQWLVYFRRGMANDTKVDNRAIAAVMAYNEQLKAIRPQWKADLDQFFALWADSLKQTREVLESVLAIGAYTQAYEQQTKVRPSEIEKPSAGGVERISADIGALLRRMKAGARAAWQASMSVVEMSHELPDTGAQVVDAADGLGSAIEALVSSMGTTTMAASRSPRLLVMA